MSTVWYSDTARSRYSVHLLTTMKGTKLWVVWDAEQSTYVYSDTDREKAEERAWAYNQERRPDDG